MKKIAPILLGNTLETYDFCLYGLLAPVFAKVFFPPDFEHSLIVVFLLFAVAYLSRPFGSVVWGHIGDKYGRKPVLIGTLSVMAVAAVGMAIIPSYEVIGFYACFIILFLRLLQGIAFGGEFPTTIVMLYEISPKNRRGLFCSLVPSIGSIGHLLGILLILSVLLFGNKALYDGGWRLLFGLSVIFIVLIGYFRKNVTETLSKTNKNKLPIITTFNQYRRILTIFLFLSTYNVLYFSYIYHINVFLRSTKGLGELYTFSIQAFMVAYLIILIPIISYIGDLVGRARLIRSVIVCLAVFIIPMYALIFGNYFIIGILLLGLFASAVLGLSLSIIVEHASKNSRVSITGIAFGLSVIIFGATTPAINELLIKILNTQFAPSFYLILTSLISLVSLYYIGKKTPSGE